MKKILQYIAIVLLLLAGLPLHAQNIKWDYVSGTKRKLDDVKFGHSKTPVITKMGTATYTSTFDKDIYTIKKETDSTALGNSDSIFESYKWDSTYYSNNDTIEIKRILYFIETVTKSNKYVHQQIIVHPVYQVTDKKSEKKQIKIAHISGLHDSIIFNNRVSGWVNAQDLNILILDEWSPNNATKHQLKSQFSHDHFKLHPHRFYLNLGLGYMPSFANRSATIGVLSTSYNKQLMQRDNTEYARYGSAFTGTIGISRGLSHSFIISYTGMQQGFSTIKDSVDLASGLPYTTTRNHDYIFSYRGLSCAYRYSGYGRKLNFVAEIGAYYLWLNKLTDNGSGENEQLNSSITGRVTDAFGVKAGIGFNYRPAYWWELSVVPSLYYNLTPLSRGVINTRLFSQGITVSTNFYLHSH